MPLLSCEMAMVSPAYGCAQAADAQARRVIAPNPKMRSIMLAPLRSFSVFAYAPQMHEQRVVNERRALDGLGIVFHDVGPEALADGPQAGRFRCDVDLLRKIGAMNDERETLQCG